MRLPRGVVLAVAALAVLHNDLWWWNDPRLVLGLPVGLAYHLAFCLAATLVMAVAARRLGRGGDGGEER
ncbi:MAG: DUF3311 domain-containing protein [Acidobacteriota bacterium]|nr:DUF3311 domain-containing protein [Acidobacteriota bacterium]MDH3523141.1 DUF3311 domain-containing protein [Acidobacteriota bacterium]